MRVPALERALLKQQEQKQSAAKRRPGRRPIGRLKAKHMPRR